MSGESSTLDGRKAMILRAIVSHYVSSGEPVGSKTIAEGYVTGVSAATVRNDMAALEDAGYIFQPHTSAGRIPTDAGYRFFVNTFASDAKLPTAERRRIRAFFIEPRWEFEDALRQTASLLSSCTDHAAVVFAPPLERSIVRHIELVALDGNRAMLVLVTDTGRVQNHVILVPDDADEVMLEDTARMLNRLAAGVPLDAVADTILASLERLPLELRGPAERVGRVLADELTRTDAERVYLEGTSNIVDEDKFTDLETVRGVIGALEHRRALLEMLAVALAADHVEVYIGSEIPIHEMQRCTVITAPYRSEGAAIGSLGIVGPTRMDYRRTMAAVREVADSLGRMLASPSS
jgi:heat-inducible transcriptional repressor